MNINQLNDDCLIHLFKQFRLVELFSIRIICKRWDENIFTVFRSRKTLKLCGYSWVGLPHKLVTSRGSLLDLQEFEPKPEDSVIVREDSWNFDLEDFNEECPISLLFPNVSTLVFYLSVSCFSLVRNYPNLTTLYFRGFLDWDCSVQVFWPLLNSLPYLKRFHIFFPYFEFDEPSGELPVLSQLEHFTLVNYAGRSNGTSLILRQLGPNLEKLLVENVSFPNLEVADDTLSNLRIGENLTRLTLGYVQFYFGPEEESATQFLSLVCRTFQHLRYLNIVKFNRISFLDTVQNLVNLPNLSEAALLLDSSANLDVDQIYKLPLLKSLKTIHLKASITLSIGQLRHIFPIAFPKLLQIIFIESSEQLDVFAELVESFQDLKLPQIIAQREANFTF